jgi:hypothetical protein
MNYASYLTKTHFTSEGITKIGTRVTPHSTLMSLLHQALPYSQEGKILLAIQARLN